MVDLDIGQRGRRLVEDEHFAIEGERAGNLHELRQRCRELLHRRVRRDWNVQFVEQRLRARVHRRLVEHAEYAGFRDLAAGEDVAGDGEVRKGEHFLVDHADAALERLSRRREDELFAAPMQLAAIGLHDAREDFQQRGFPGAVFTDERVNFALGDVKRDIVERSDGAETARDVAE